jgi:hypothetical protein
MLRNRALLAVAAGAIAGLMWIGQGICQDNAPRNDRRTFDPAQFQQRMMDRMKETLGASDEDWKALGPKVQKVMTLAQEARGGMGMAMMGRGGRGGRGGGDAAATPAPEPTTETGKTSQALSKLLDNKDSKPEDIKTALQAFRDAKVKAEVALEAAQKDLKAVLTVRQEALLVLRGMLK